MANTKKNAHADDNQADAKSTPNKSDQLKTAADFDQLARQAEEETKTRKPGASGGNKSNQHNNGRGGGK